MIKLTSKVSILLSIECWTIIKWINTSLNETLDVLNNYIIDWNFKWIKLVYIAF